ncbi:uncharacterized protein TrAFT101_000792 [Trichoderma asperellum]|uniref:Uncharacterized protein n=2 Tax=Trichoderma asperellum TaxID=101201 RepID=A0A2T3ZKL0_TRIA4|nr:hypothetical protein M441DRAFT_129627 [Trichoderma asperellum CBS 433.97]PTB45339.1 hypothetical protein M441DRAFT_129627 [Trichoderma asperellum CBS 433.97]UKZ84903.1 hypothetical protein TrAFT101_000792 [Trichoderma asperellum]
MASESLQQHQRFLAAVLNTAHEPLDAEERAMARIKFYRIIDRYSKRKRDGSKYKRHLLIRYTYEYALSEESRIHFLQTFYQALELSIDGEGRVNLDDKEQADKLWLKISAFADFLVDNFYLPLKASARRAPLPTLMSQPAVPDLITDPREDCLIRDRHRCVITQAFDFDEAVSRHKQYADEAKDDEERSLFKGGNHFLHLEAAPVLPHSLAEIGSSPSELSRTKKLTLEILNIFDNGIQKLINECVGKPRNAMTLTKNYHHMFGEFEFYFTRLDGPNDPPHTYKIDNFLSSPMRKELPVTRTFYTEADGKTIDPPEPRFLALRRSLAHVLYLSSAGQYIDELLKKLKEKPADEDGSTELGLFAQLRLDGWCPATNTERQ